MDNDITAIVNIFRRENILEQQIKAIKEQSIPPKSIIIWNNGNTKIDLTKYKNDKYYKVFDCNYNSGVWSRFIISQLADTEYICIFDDDTIPEKNWFKNCMECMIKKEALYGTIGVIFKNSEKYEFYRRYGWDSINNGNNTEPKPVDIVGHSWFFKKKWISYLLRESPKVNEYFSVGEDIYFSFMLQKYGNIPTYVPPHPSTDISLFGSNPKLAFKIGCDGNSGSNIKCTFDIALNDAKKEGFRTLLKRQNAKSDEDLEYFMDKIRNKENFAIIRPGDGEYNILENKTLTTIDNWTFYQNGKLSKNLNDSLYLASNRNCYIGIPCGNCNLNMARYYINKYKLNPLYTTFANIFVNKNWKNWINFLINEKISFIYIGPHNLPENKFIVEKYINIPLYLVNDWDKKGEEYKINLKIEIKKYINKIFMFSAGPISKIIISELWNEHPKNIYLDVGSSFDLFSKGKSNREYIKENSELSKLICNFDLRIFDI